MSASILRQTVRTLISCCLVVLQASLASGDHTTPSFIVRPPYFCRFISLTHKETVRSYDGWQFCFRSVFWKIVAGSIDPLAEKLAIRLNTICNTLRCAPQTFRFQFFLKFAKHLMPSFSRRHQLCLRIEFIVAQLHTVVRILPSLCMCNTNLAAH